MIFHVSLSLYLYLFLHTNKRYCSEEEVEEGDDRMFDSPGVADRSCGLEAVKGVLRQPGPSYLVRHGAVVRVMGHRCTGHRVTREFYLVYIQIHHH